MAHTLGFHLGRQADETKLTANNVSLPYNSGSNLRAPSHKGLAAQVMESLTILSAWPGQDADPGRKRTSGMCLATQ